MHVEQLNQRKDAVSCLLISMCNLVLEISTRQHQTKKGNTMADEHDKAIRLRAELDQANQEITELKSMLFEAQR
jgi:uncharacterized protein YlxW (UPF0749 family)